MRAHSVDLRKKIVDAVLRRGYPKRRLPVTLGLVSIRQLLRKDG
jgi:hypothetical protein